MSRKLPDLSVIENSFPYLEELVFQSDRACGIVAAAMLETRVEQLLRQVLVQGTEHDLFVAYGPLGSFAAKINMAAALGLISATEQRELHGVRRIRNDLAHELDQVSFDKEPVKAHLAALQLTRSRLLKEPTTPRQDFHSEIAILVGSLAGRRKRPKRLRPPEDQLAAMIRHFDQAYPKGPPPHGAPSS